MQWKLVDVMVVHVLHYYFEEMKHLRNLLNMICGSFQVKEILIYDRMELHNNDTLHHVIVNVFVGFSA